MRRIEFVAAACAAGLALSVFSFHSGCRTADEGGDRPAGAPLSQARGPNAYDVVKMCRFSDEEGPVYFAHAAHADLKTPSGAAISCSRCHHELNKDPEAIPRACSRCHLQHDHYEAKDLLTM